MDIDLRQIRYFIAVAEQLNFVRAAAELQMTQPALSRQIQALEQGLNVKLLSRGTRGTALTGAGRQLLEDARPLLEASLALERRVRAAARADTEFVVGFMPGVPSTALVQEFIAKTPGITVDVMYVSMSDQEPYLIDGRVDISFVRLPLQSKTLRAIPLFKEPRVAVLPATNDLAGKQSIRLDELRGLPLIDDLATLPEWRGDTLPRRRTLVTIEERMEAVASGAGFIVVPAGLAKYYALEGITSILLEDIPAVTVALAYTKHRTMPEIQRFAELTRTHFGIADD
ncbi:MAG: LysR family transcriptional regulator [Thermomicrobiales bacterium]